MRAFKGCMYTKKQAVAKAAYHEEHDQFVKGTYGDGEYNTEDFLGCSVGCMANGKHDKFPSLYGIDTRIAYLADAIFEGLPEPEHLKFTKPLFESIPTGCDTTRVYYQFMHWMLADMPCTTKPEIREAVYLFERAIVGDVAEEQKWQTLANVAGSDFGYLGNPAMFAVMFAARSSIPETYASCAANAVANGARTVYDVTGEPHGATQRKYRDQLIKLFQSSK